MSSIPCHVSRLCVLLTVVCSPWITPTGWAADEAVRAGPPTDTDDMVIVPSGETVLFKVASGARVLSCVGRFANADGRFDGPFTSSLKVKFGAAAEGRSNLCTVAVTTPGPAGQPPVTETDAIHVVVPKRQSRTLAHVPGSSDDRTSLGVGEEVMFTIQPAELLLDFDVAWSLPQPWSWLSRRAGLSTIYTAGFPSPKNRTHQHTATGEASGTATLHFRYATDEVTLFFGGASAGSRRDRGNARYLAFKHRHTPAALATAYTTKLDWLETQFAAHEFSAEPLETAQQDTSHRQVPPIYLQARGFAPVLCALATLQSHAPGSTTDEQPEALRAREVRLVARMVFTFHQALDPAINLYNFSRPDYFDAKLPEGFTPLPGRLNLEGRYRPEDIREPELRRQFAKAIAENNAKIAAWDRQYRANDTDDTLRRFAWDYLQEVCGRSDLQLEEFKQELRALGADERTALMLATRPQELPVEDPPQR